MSRAGIPQTAARPELAGDAAVPAVVESSSDLPARGAKIAIEQLVRGVATIGASFYVLGFLTTNAYLYKLGVSDFSLLRTRFILTGVLTMTPLVLALIGGIYAAVDIAAHRGDHDDKLTARAYGWILSDIAIPFTLYFGLFAVVAENDLITSARDAVLLSAVCAVIVWAGMAVLALYRVSERRPLSHLASRAQHGVPFSYERFRERFGIPDLVVESLIFGVGGFVLFLAYIGVFGQYFYPTLPEQLGGGRPRIAQFLIAESAVPAARELGIEVAAGAPLSAPLKLLWEGEESYVIRLPKPNERTVVQLARSLVEGVVTGEPLALVAEPSPTP